MLTHSFYHVEYSYNMCRRESEGEHCLAMHSPALTQIDVSNGSQQTIILSVDSNKMLHQVKQPNGWGS